MDSAQPRAAAIAVGGGRVLAVGAREDLAGLAGSGTRRIDAAGATVLPGFVESHIHLFTGAAQLSSLSLAGLEGFEPIASAIRARAVREPGTRMLIVEQAGYGMFGGEPITRQLLDRILPDRPLALFASDHHTMWGNTAALEMAGLIDGLAVSPGNEVVLGPDGRAAGELREFEAFAPIIALTPTGGREALGLLGREPAAGLTAAERATDRAIIERGLAYCASLGITAFHNMDGNVYQLELLGEIDRAGGLIARGRVPFRFLPGMALSELDRAVEMRARWQGGRLSSDFVKIFMDGVVESYTAHMFEDYSNAPGLRGSSYFEAAEFDAIATAIDALGFQITVHAIGDAAVSRTLDGYAAARRANGARDSRHRIEHIEVLAPADLPRFAELGVIASMQPTHAPGGAYPMEPIRTMLGRERMALCYAWQSIRASGARLAFSSDWPIAPMDPLYGIRTAMTCPAAFPGLPDQRQTLTDAIAGFTRDGAYAAFREDEQGVLKAGALADLVILDGDIEAMAAEAVDTLKVAATMCDGRITYERGVG
ncbi:amidohydrolase [Ancylobacter crimeensis]|nr:amidohydrolase [Ancylobacter crimeensis]